MSSSRAGIVVGGSARRATGLPISGKLLVADERASIHALVAGRRLGASPHEPRPPTDRSRAPPIAPATTPRNPNGHTGLKVSRAAEIQVRRRCTVHTPATKPAPSSPYASPEKPAPANSKTSSAPAPSASGKSCAPWNAKASWNTSATARAAGGEWRRGPPPAQPEEHHERPPTVQQLPPQRSSETPNDREDRSRPPRAQLSPDPASGGVPASCPQEMCESSGSTSDGRHPRPPTGRRPDFPR